MKASEAGLLQFLRKSPRLIIPIYQRTYSWTRDECEQLWNDIVRSGSRENVSGHFIGSVVYIEQQLSQVINQSPLLVIDGQQRITTVSLILEAFARAIGEEEPVPGYSARKTRNYYLVNPEETGAQYYKLELTQTDKESLFAIVRNKPLPNDYSYRIKDNFEFFQQQVRRLSGDYTALANGLGKLVVVDVALKRGEDNPQLIFESMNSTGRELSQADLIRNYVLMGLDAVQQEQLYVDYWRPMETAFGQQTYGQHFDSFMRHYLTYRTGEIPRIGAVYDAFKAYSRTDAVVKAGTEALVSDLRQFANYYVAMALAGRESDNRLSAAFQDLRELQMDVAYPLLLQAYSDYDAAVISRDELLSIIRLLESYVFRRAVCNVPTNTLNKTFASMGKSIESERYLESLGAQLESLSTYRRFPDDAEFAQNLKTRDVYNFRRSTYLLRRLENAGRKETVSINEYSIEHIMPQNDKLSAKWRTALGDDWQRIHQTYLHTLGNITLTGYNSEYSDKPFTEKRCMKGGFSESPLQLNQGLGTLAEWNEPAIRERADRLARVATVLWAYPRLTSKALESARRIPSDPVTVGYTFADHQHLESGTSTRQMFDRFAHDVLALDPGMTTEVRKDHVAFKAETNVVDVVPQASGLLLFLNMEFDQVIDPRGICSDVSDTGHLGNGDVSLHLRSIEELPYVIGLVRQSLEIQMGSETA